MTRANFIELLSKECYMKLSLDQQGQAIVLDKMGMELVHQLQHMWLTCFLYRSGGSCTAAAFLKEFVTVPAWAHLDIAGVMENKDEIPYLGKGMTGKGPHDGI